MLRSPHFCFPVIAAAFLCACNGPVRNAPLVDGVALPPTEFRAELVNFDQEALPMEVNSKLGRFRMERKELVYLGDLNPSGEITVLDPAGKTYFQIEKGRESRLFQSHGRAAATRYRSAVDTSSLRSYHQQALAPFRSPCEAVLKQTQQHKVCQWEDRADQQRVFRHTYFGRRGMQERFKKVQSTTKHVYDTRLGVVLEGPYSYFQNLEELDLDDKRFLIPEDYSELLSDEALADSRFQYIGEPTMVEGEELEPFMSRVSQDPKVPRTPEWIFQAEKWWVKGDSQRVLYIERGYPFVAFDPSQVPFNLDYKFQIEAWDPEPEVGEYSYRSSGGELVFYAKGQLFKVRVPKQSFQTDELDIARTLLRNVSELDPRLPHQIHKESSSDASR